jgi:hypothetical protein
MLGGVPESGVVTNCHVVVRETGVWDLGKVGVEFLLLHLPNFCGRSPTKVRGECLNYEILNRLVRGVSMPLGGAHSALHTSISDDRFHFRVLRVRIVLPNGVVTDDSLIEQAVLEGILM